jgi:hypothetical protein
VRWHGNFNTCAPAPHRNGHVQYSWRR